MSAPTEVKNPISPFVPTTTPDMERANRLMSLKSHPGFLDLVRISHDLAESVIQQMLAFQGWDLMQIATVRAAAQGANEHHRGLFAAIDALIEKGTAEAMEQIANAQMQKTPQEIIEQSDHVRRTVLQKFAQMDDNQQGDPTRIPGSY